MVNFAGDNVSSEVLKFKWKAWDEYCTKYSVETTFLYYMIKKDKAFVIEFLKSEVPFTRLFLDRSMQ